jgi:nucleotide-binding universal stress UspA family protein
MLTHPSLTPEPYQNVVANAEDSPYVEQALRIACGLCATEKAKWLHIVREIKMYGLTMAISDQGSEEEYDEHRHGLVNFEIEAVQQLLSNIPHENVRVNIKILAGKSGFELAKFAEKKRADLLIVGAPRRRLGLFDRMFPHDLEYIFADLPCDLLIVRQRKEAKGG